MLYNLGKIAFNDLISKTSHLVFKLDTLKEALGARELELALKVGIVSQMRAPGRFHIPKVSIEFFHKSMQEAIAALYIVCDKTDRAFTSLSKYCCSVRQSHGNVKRAELYGRYKSTLHLQIFNAY